MSSPPKGLDSELDTFRRQWLSDLQQSKQDESSSARHAQRAPHQLASRQPPPSSARRHSSSQPQQQPAVAPPLPSLRRPAPGEDDEGYVEGLVFDEAPPSTGYTLDGKQRPAATDEKQLVSALDHFEKAMEKEALGNMGDSLSLYRKAYKLDYRVDSRYREKHFPQTQPSAPTATTSAATASLSSNKTAATAQTISTAAAPPPASDPVLPTADLIASFSRLKLEPAPPEVEGGPPPPCPIANLPDELLIHVMQDVAVADVGDFARLALVCKQFTYLVATEERIWRRVCEGSEFGFGDVPLRFRKTINWADTELEDDGYEDEDNVTGNNIILSPREVAHRRRAAAAAFTAALMPSAYSSWKSMFRSRPRIRFNGCYISTVNYVRSGQASTNQPTWGPAPILIVTYYRYLRFFRDGTVISLLTTSEPGDVVHHLTRDLLVLHRGAAHSHLPSAMMAHALRGRWRVSSAMDYPDAAPKDQEGDLMVETEGVGPKYMYRMDMSLRTAGKTARNNKIIWRGFYSYNKLTDDWAEFGLKNDKAFFFSRVKSYGVSE